MSMIIHNIFANFCLCALLDLFHCREHVERAWVDMQRFKEQKDKDLREALINYAVMQISMCKKVEKSISAVKKLQDNWTGHVHERMFLFPLSPCREYKCGAMPKNVSSRCNGEAIFKGFPPSVMLSCGCWKNEASVLWLWFTNNMRIKMM